MLGNSERPAASQEGLSSMELVTPLLFLLELEEATMNLSQDGWFPGQIYNREPVSSSDAKQEH
jgi:hypothetical protein